MDLSQLQTLFATSPAIQLLRARNAPYILDFLHRQFKEAQRLCISDSDLRVALQDYQEDLQEMDPAALPESATSYLTAWCREDARYLHRFYESGRAGGEASFQLTSHAEEVLQFVDRMTASELGFVATESRVKLILDSLEDIVVYSSDDPEERVHHLRAEQKRLEEEILRIEREGSVEKYHSVQIRERFGLIIDLLKQLLSDFRQVEEAFKGIARELQKRQVAAEGRQGDLLGYALDAEDLLREQDQGRSFEAFTKLILSHNQQQKLRGLIDHVAAMEELIEHSSGVRTLRQSPRQLLAEAQKVMSTTQRLSGQLRLLLDDRATADRRRTRQLLQEIREIAGEMADDPLEDAELSLTITLGPAPLRSPMMRDFWSPPHELEAIEIREVAADTATRHAAFRHYAELARLDWPEMRARIREATAGGKRVSLNELVTAYPPQSGAIEIVGYVQLARDDGHLIEPEVMEKIMVPVRNKGHVRMLEMPRVVFLPAGANV